jgi:hydroxymethylpyrimidine/phosphomethylpyrimidine kinase
MATGVLISLAGFDPTSGAGVTLDLKVFASYGFHGMGLCAAITVQNTQAVRGLQCIPCELVLQQYGALEEDVRIRGIKVGMLGCREHIRSVTGILERSARVPVVIDPVLRSSSGTWLFERDAVDDYMAALAGRITLLTPNLAEASWITGSDLSCLEDMHAAARKIYQDYGIPSLIKGGHLAGDAVDLLFDGSSFQVFEKEKIPGNVHGTGCFFSSSVLCLLVQGHPLGEACRLAGDRTLEAIRGAVPVGKGHRLILPK